MTWAREEAERILDAIPKHPASPLVDWRHSASGRRHRDAIEAALVAARRDALARAERAEAALVPFAAWINALDAEFSNTADDVIAGGLDGMSVTFGDLRRARAALTPIDVTRGLD